MESWKLNDGTQLQSFNFKNKINANGIEFQPGKSVVFYKDGEIKGGMLAKDVVVNGMNFKKGTLLYLYQNGKIEQGFLSKPTVLPNKIKLAANTWVQFSNDGKIKKAFEDPKIVHTFDHNIRLNSNSQILPNKVEVGGQKYLRAEFRHDGSVANGIASRVQVDGVTFISGDIKFSPSGKVVNATGGIVIANNLVMHEPILNQSGGLESARLSYDTKINGRSFPAYSTIVFDNKMNILKIK